MTNQSQGTQPSIEDHPFLQPFKEYDLKKTAALFPLPDWYLLYHPDHNYSAVHIPGPVPVDCLENLVLYEPRAGS